MAQNKLLKIQWFVDGEDVCFTRENGERYYGLKYHSDYERVHQIPWHEESGAGYEFDFWLRLTWNASQPPTGLKPFFVD